MFKIAHFIFINRHYQLQMKTIILNCNPDKSDITAETMVAQTVQLFGKLDHQIQQFNLRNMNINYCIGCWDCWVKTPGICKIKDDMSQILKAVINSDLVIFLSPLNMGFISSEMKKIQERIIPLVLPNIDIVEDEFHHKKRYDKYPKLGLIMLREMDTTDEDIQINTDIFNRFALNFRTDVLFSMTYGYKYEEKIYEACSNKWIAEKAQEQLEVVNG